MSCTGRWFSKAAICKKGMQTGKPCGETAGNVAFVE